VATEARDHGLDEALHFIKVGRSFR